MTPQQPLPRRQPGATTTFVDPAYTPRPRRRPAPSRAQVRVPATRDRVRWGPVLAGLVVALATYLVMQLGLVAADAAEVVDPAAEDAVISAIAAAIAFLLGGIVAGATARVRGAFDGVLHGIVLWATGLVAIAVLSAVAGGLVLGTLDSTDAFDEATATAVDTAQTQQDRQDAAQWALMGLGSALAAAAVGGALGAKMWPRQQEVIDLRDRTMSRTMPSSIR